jgi:hypothetical protein
MMWPTPSAFEVISLLVTAFIGASFKSKIGICSAANNQDLPKLPIKAQKLIISALGTPLCCE